MTAASRALRILALAALGAAAGGCAQLEAPAAARAADAAPASAAASAPANTPTAPASAASAPARSGPAATSAAPPPAGPAQAGSAPVKPAAPPGGLRPFAEVIKGAQRSEGLFALWQEGEKVWIEIHPSALNRPYFLSPRIKTGIGESYLFGGLLGFEAGIVEFRRIHNQVQLVWRNTDFVAPPDTPEAAAVAVAFSPSLVASAAVASQPHPQSGAWLVEANALFVADLTGTATQLQRTYRQPYAFDPRNSAVTAQHNRADATTIEVLQHFAAPMLAATQATQPGAPVPSVPRSLPDARSLFVTMGYTLARLPEQVLQPRPADARIGHFTTVVVDFGDDLARDPRRRYVDRWRLEKKDPAAALSEPLRPIAFRIDRSVPLKYRAAVEAGVLEWNKAFEAIGFKEALRVETDAAPAIDLGRVAIRWMTNARPAFGGLGQRQVDPRSGEILQAAIALESLDARNVRAVRSQILAPVSFTRGAAVDECEFADASAEQLGYAIELLATRGEIDPASPEVQRWVEDYVRQVTLHEVGHALGLRHNFRASRAYSDAELADPRFTAAHGTAASVMDYLPINLGAPQADRALQREPFTAVLGPYDYWAIEYAYRPLAPADEAAALARIAARSAEPRLAFGSDDDVRLGIDPEVQQLDLGDDIVAFARKRLAIAQDMLRRQEYRPLDAEQGYAVLRRSVVYAVNDVGRAAAMLARQVGGIRTLRDAPGSGRDPLLPLPADAQREALALLTAELLAPESLQVSPALQRRLAPDYFARREALAAGESAGTDYAITAQLLEVQRSLIGALTADAVAVRLLDSAPKAGPGAPAALTLAELHAALAGAIWGELGRPRFDIAPLRRELQRAYVNRVAALLLQPQALTRADARSLVRVQAAQLAPRIDAASRRPGLAPEVRAHLKDSAETLQRALAAPLERSAP